MHCPKHGCVMTETITDDVFCGVCRTTELLAALKPFAEIGESYETDLPQAGDEKYRNALRAYRNATRG